MEFVRCTEVVRLSESPLLERFHCKLYAAAYWNSYYSEKVLLQVKD